MIFKAAGKSGSKKLTSRQFKKKLRTKNLRQISLKKNSWKKNEQTSKLKRIRGKKSTSGRLKRTKNPSQNDQKSKSKWPKPIDHKIEMKTTEMGNGNGLKLKPKCRQWNAVNWFWSHHFQLDKSNRIINQWTENADKDSVTLSLCFWFLSFFVWTHTQRPLVDFTKKKKKEKKKKKKRRRRRRRRKM